MQSLVTLDPTIICNSRVKTELHLVDELLIADTVFQATKLRISEDLKSLIFNFRCAKHIKTSFSVDLKEFSDLFAYIANEIDYHISFKVRFEGGVQFAESELCHVLAQAYLRGVGDTTDFHSLADYEEVVNLFDLRDVNNILLFAAIVSMHSNRQRSNSLLV